jgi:hypothetical protein
MALRPPVIFCQQGRQPTCRSRCGHIPGRNLDTCCVAASDRLFRAATCIGGRVFLIDVDTWFPTAEIPASSAEKSLSRVRLKAPGTPRFDVSTSSECPPSLTVVDTSTSTIWTPRLAVGTSPLDADRRVHKSRRCDTFHVDRCTPEPSDVDTSPVALSPSVYLGIDAP